MNNSGDVEKPRRILLLQTNPADAEPILHNIRESGLPAVSKCVSDQEEFLAALTKFEPEVILADYQLAGFTGLEALSIVRQTHPNLPFILVAEALGEDLAVESFRHGAADYIRIDRLATLVPAIRRAIEEAEQRIQRPMAEELIREQNRQLRLQIAALQKDHRELEVSRERFARLYDTAPIGYTNLSEEGLICEINPTAAQLLGEEPGRLIGKMFRQYVSPADASRVEEHLQKCLMSKRPVRTEVELAISGQGQRAVELFSVSAIEPGRDTIFCQTAITDITELMRSEDARRETEERFRQLTENIREVFWMTDPKKTRMLYISPGYEAIWGRTCQSLQVSPRNWIEAVHEEDRERVMEAALTKQISGEYDEVYRIVRPDGSIRWIHDRAFPVRDYSGEVYRIVGIADEITTHKRAEQRNIAFSRLGTQLSAVSTAREAAQIIMEIADGFFGWDFCHVCLCAPEDTRIVPILTVDSIGGRRVEIEPDSLNLEPSPMTRFVMKHGAQLVNEDSPLLAQVPLSPVGDKGRRCASRMFAPLRKGTNVLGIISIQSYRSQAYSQDDLELLQALADHCGGAIQRVKVSELLRESEEQFRSLFEFAPIGIALQNGDGRFVHINRSYQEMFGYPEEELKKLGVKGITFPEDVAEGKRFFDDLREGRRDSYHRAKRYLRQDGRIVWAESSASAVRDAAGRLRYIVSMVEDVTGRKEAEDQVRMLANAVQSAQELIAITDQENRFQFINRAFLRAYGYGEHEILGRRPDFLYAPTEPRGLCDQIFQKSFGGGWQGEILRSRKDGTTFPVFLSTSPITSGDGRTLGLVGVATDITERKRVEKQETALALLEHHLSAATTHEQAAGAILEIASQLFGWDAGYVHLYLPAKDRIIPILTVDTLNGQRTPVSPGSFTLDPSPLMRDIMKKGARLINESKGIETTVPLIAFGDTQRPSASRMYVTIQSGETIRGVLSIQSYTPAAYVEADLQLLQKLADHSGDTFQRIEAAEAVRVAETKYRRIFEDATEGIFQTLPDGRFRSVNPALARMLGYPTPEALVSGITHLGRQTYVIPEKWEELGHLLKTQGFVEGFEAERYRKDGSRIWMSTNAHVVHDENGEILYYEGTNQDITERKLAEEELRRLSRRIIEAQESERQRVAHELHDGVNQIIASARMRLRNVEQKISAQSPAAGEIVSRCNQLLVQALEENRRIARNLRPSDLDELGLPTACKHLCEEFQSRTRLVVKTRVPRIWSRLSPMVELNLFRIVQEALANVEKHAHAKMVWLRLAEESGTVVLKIRDDGRGVDPKNLRGAKKQRSGIGLTNMRERAAAMEGSCTVAFKLKKGTTITVRVPRKNAE